MRKTAIGMWTAQDSNRIAERKKSLPYRHRVSPLDLASGEHLTVACDFAEPREGAECPGGRTVEAFLLDDDVGLT